MGVIDSMVRGARKIMEDPDAAAEKIKENAGKQGAKAVQGATDIAKKIPTGIGPKRKGKDTIGSLLREAKEKYL